MAVRKDSTIRLFGDSIPAGARESIKKLQEISDIVNNNTRRVVIDNNLYEINQPATKKRSSR